MTIFREARGRSGSWGSEGPDKRHTSGEKGHKAVNGGNFKGMGRDKKGVCGLDGAATE